jgi:hypothetical protein
VTTQDAKRINSQRLSHLHLLRDFGPTYLDEHEYSTRLTALLNDYYNSLALGVFDFKQADFWQHQKSELRKLGFPLNYARLLRAVVVELFSNPRGVARRLKAKLNRTR